MPEIVTASLVNKPKPSLTETGESVGEFPYSAETIAQLKAHVMEFLAANAIDPQKVLFAGFDAEQSKDTDEEHRTEAGVPIYFFGDAHSLEPPQSMSGDDETRAEHWMVNPLLYAIENHSLGVYDRALLEQLAGGSPIDSDPAEQSEFGTYAYTIDGEKLEQAKVAQLTI